MSIYELALNKIIVIVGIKRNDITYYFSGTRNKKIVDLCNGDSSLLNNVESNNEDFIEFYDLKNDVLEKIDLKNGEFFEFTLPGLPFEIAPPMFLNPKWENEQNNETLIELQQDVIDVIKSKKHIPAFKDNAVNQNRINDSLNFFNNAKEFGIDSELLLKEKDELYYFKLTCDGDHLDKFNAEFKKYYELIHLKPVFNKLGYTFSSINELKNIVNNEAQNIKNKWIQYLENKKTAKLTELNDYFNQTKQNITDTNILNVAIFQFEETKRNIENASYSNILSKTDDIRIFLRYSPDYLDNSDLFSSIAPFDDYDYKIINNIIVNEIATTEEHFKEIFDRGLEYFCTNHLNEIREKRKQQILAKRDEVLNSLTAQEKANIAPFLSNEAVLNKLDVVPGYYDVLSFWPPVLGNRPEYVLPS